MDDDGGMVVMASARAYSSVVLLLQLITITETGALTTFDAPYLSGTCTACRLIHPVNGTRTGARLARVVVVAQSALEAQHRHLS
jgi:hypothetical protein